MKEIKLKRSFRKALCIMELGKHYRVYSSYMNNLYIKDCTLIRVGKKGFNLLSMEKNKCMFSHNIYQKDSAKKAIKKDQIIFEIVLPDWITRIEAFDDGAPTKLIDTGDAKEAMEEAEEVKKTSWTRNALYRIEL